MEKCFKNLIFDIDGTLWDTTAVVAVGWNRALKEKKVPELENLIIDADMLKKEFGKPMDVIADDLFGDIDANVKAELLKLCCIYEHEEIVNNMLDLAYYNIRETMNELANNHRLFIVSNCQDGYIELVIEKNNLTGIIRDFECFGHTGLQKDENIRLLMERNGINDDEAVYIGDTMGDYTATKKAGIKFVFADYGFGEVDFPDYIVKTPSDLLTLCN